MAISDYIPNVFGASNPMYEGLLGAEDAAALSQRSNVAGLLGAAAALATGMGSQGPRRSALQNVLGALAAGYGTSGQAYQAGIEQMANAQKLAQARLESAKLIQANKAVDELVKNDPRIANDPLKVAYFRANPTEALKLYSETLPLEAAAQKLKPTISAQPQATAPQATTTADSQDIASQYIQQAQSAGAPVTVTAPAGRGQQLVAQRDQLVNTINVYSAPEFIANKRAQEIVAAARESLKTINTELGRSAVEGYDWSALENSLPNEFKQNVAALKQIAEAGEITPNDLAQRIEKIQEQAFNYQQKATDYTNEVRRTAAELYPNTPIHKLSQDQMKRLNAVLLQRDKEARRAGATTIAVGDKVLAGERAKAQSRAEENAINAQNSASDVRAIVDILKPYRGGALQDFAGSIGAYLPGTQLEQLATARQAAEAIRAKLAPTLRVEGSGATSDFEIKSFLAAIPSLFNTAEGREIMAVYAEKLANRAVEAADIRARLIEENNGKFYIKEYQKALKDAGLTQVFTPEDLQILSGKKAPQGGVNLSSPAAQQAYEKYKPR